MIPLVGSEEEMQRLRERTDAVLERVESEMGVELRIPIGTMIEMPAGGPGRRPDRRATPSSSPSAPTT